MGKKPNPRRHRRHRQPPQDPPTIESIFIMSREGEAVGPTSTLLLKNLSPCPLGHHHRLPISQNQTSLALSSLGPHPRPRLPCPDTLDSTSPSTMTAAMDARRHSPSDRLLGLMPHRPPLDGADFDEHDVFWSGDSSGGSGGEQSDPPRLSRSASGGGVRRAPVKQGILAALFEDDGEERTRPVHRRAAAAGSPSWTAIPAIPRPPREVGFSQSLPAERFYQSAPRSVPITSGKLGKSEMGGGGGLVEGSDEEEGDQMLPPHEIVARRSSAVSPFTTFSVLEGQGRTLKGRDLRRVRNAVLTRTGFLD